MGNDTSALANDQLLLIGLTASCLSLLLLHFSPIEDNDVVGLCFKTLLSWEYGLLEFKINLTIDSSFPKSS